MCEKEAEEVEIFKNASFLVECTNCMRYEYSQEFKDDWLSEETIGKLNLKSIEEKYLKRVKDYLHKKIENKEVLSARELYFFIENLKENMK